MLKTKDKTNMRIKNKLLPEIDSDANRFKKLHYSEISSKENKINNSYLSNDENNEYNENQKYISVLNDLDIISNNNSTNNNTKKSPIEEINKNNNNPFIVYKEIKLYIEKFISDYTNEKASTYFVLKEILNATLIIIKDFIENNNNSSSINNKLNLFVTEDEEINNENNNNPNLELDIKSKIVFLLKIHKLNNTIKKLREEMEFYKSIMDVPKKKFGNNFLNLFKKKFFEQKAKSKREELNYLLCIGEQEKKINSLEKEINKKEKENLPTEIIKSIRCFPNFHQYDFKEDINPKSIPLFQQFQKEKEKKIDKYFKKNIFNSPNNLSRSIKNKKNLLNNNSSNNRTKLILTNTEFKKIKKESNANSCKIKKNKVVNLDKIKTYNLSLINNNNINKEKKEYKNLGLSYKIGNINTDSNIINNKEEKYQKKIYEYFKDYYPKTILDNKKEFFIAHPTLNIAGVVNKKEVKYVGLPKKIIKLKFHKNLEQNMMITFPSSLNETLVNLEKLRKCKHVNNVNN